mgnify:FL=1
MQTNQQTYDENFINNFLQTIDWSMEEINNGVSLSTGETHHLFQIHNRFVNPNSPEYSQSCSGCRLRVYKKVILWYHERDWKTFTPKLYS